MMKVSTCAKHAWCGEATMMIEIVTTLCWLQGVCCSLGVDCSLAIHNAVLRACLEDVSTLKDLLKSATKCLKMLKMATEETKEGFILWAI